MPLEKDIQELTTAVCALTKIMASGREIDSFVKGEQEKKTVKSKPPNVEAESIPMADKVTYTDVKSAVLEVAKKKGREASLDLLTPFGVVKGEGAERIGSITSLKEEQWALVAEAARKMLEE